MVEFKVNDKSYVALKDSDLDYAVKAELEAAGWRVATAMATMVRRDIYTKVQKKTGNLGLTVQPYSNWSSSNVVTAGLAFDNEVAPYMRTHIRFPGRGSYQTIYGKPFLTVPIKGGPAYNKTRPHKTSKAFGKLDLIPAGRAGNKYALLVKPWSERQGDKRSLRGGNAVFSLRPFVKVKRRIDASDYIPLFQTRFAAAATKVITNVITKWTK
jgi:hypothetical protein